MPNFDVNHIHDYTITVNKYSRLVTYKFENAYYITTIEERTRVVFHDASGKERIVQLYIQLCFQMYSVKQSYNINGKQ